MSVKFNRQGRINPVLPGNISTVYHDHNIYPRLDSSETEAGGAILIGTVTMLCSSTVAVTVRGQNGSATLSCTANITLVSGNVLYGSINPDNLIGVATLTAHGYVLGLPHVAITGSADVFVYGTKFQAGKCQLWLKDVNRNGWLATNSLDITDDLNQRNTCHMRLNVPIGTDPMPAVGDSFYITNGVSIQFSGTIEHVAKKTVGASGIILMECDGVDWHQACDRRLAAKVYTNKTLSFIVKDLVTTYLQADGIMASDVVLVGEDPIVAKAVFNYQTITESFNELCELTGFAWYIDYAKILHVVNHEQIEAPFDIVAGVNAHVQDFTTTESRDMYRNRQYVRSFATTGSLNESFTGDFNNRTFTLAYPLAKTPDRITVNGVTQIVAVRGSDNLDADWYYSVGEKEISQNEDSQLWPSLTTLDTIQITYKGLYPTLVMQEDAAEQATMRTREGGSGIYENIESDSRIEELQQGIDAANSLIRRYGNLAEEVSFETDLVGLRAGQYINITMPDYGITDRPYLITSISARDIHGLYLRYIIRAVYGEYRGSWLDFFRALAGMKLLAAGKQFVLRDDEVIQQFVGPFNDTGTLTDSITITERDSSLNPYLIGASLVSRCEIT